ncbi:MAG: serine/threonine-protein kinase [Bryobacterales bacterium]|nr:serine/threonine-protein kinase [Bryobacterales bacterium]
MTLDPRRWERAKDIYTEACRLPAPERQSFVEQQCGSDAALQGEVLSLLAFHTAAGSFLETGPNVPSAPQRIGSYRILSPIGYGGMSAVYLGMRDDGQFEKRVAIKIMRAGIFGGEVTRRFHRERQLLAEFDHPHIVRLLDGGVAADGRPYLIQDFVDGYTLSEWLQRQQPDARERLRLFADLCKAVDYVHSRGVVHRDLKPSNVLVTNQGVVKLLDFGIAKLLDHAGADQAGTLTAQMLGTPAYASPEQMMGNKVGPASDIYSLGLVLYECFTGRQARQSSGWHETMRLLEKKLDLRELPADVAAVVKRCTQPAPEARYASASQLLGAVRALEGRPRDVPGTSRFWRVSAAIVGLAVVAAGLHRMRLQPPESTLAPHRKLEGELPSFSPDGSKLALIDIPKDKGRRRIKIRNLMTGEEKRYSLGQAVKWSPDGAKLAFIRSAGETLTAVLVLDPDSGTEREILRRPAVDSNFSSAIAWTADSRAVITPIPESGGRGRSLWAIDIATNQRTRLTSAPAGIYGDIDAAMTADGKRLAFVRAEAANISDVYWKQIGTGPDGPVHAITADRRRIEGVEWMPGDQEVAFASRRSLAKSAIWKVAAASQPVEPVLLGSEEGDCAYPSVARTLQGTLRLAYWHRRREANLYVRDAPDYSRDRPVASGPLERYSASISSNGERIVFNANETGNFELYTTTGQGAPAMELTAMRGPYTGSGQWSPDLRRIAFESSFGANRDVFIIPAEGGSPQRFTTDPSNEGRPFWSRDGKWIYFRSNRSGIGQIWRKRSDGSGEAVQITRGGGVDPIESMDGKTLYYLKSQSDPGIWSVPISGGEERMLIPGVLLEQWTVTSLGILYLDRLVHAVHTPVKAFDPAGGTARVLTAVPCANYCVLFTATPDGKRLLWGAIERDQSDTRLVELP